MKFNTLYSQFAIPVVMVLLLIIVFSNSWSYAETPTADEADPAQVNSSVPSTDEGDEPATDVGEKLQRVSAEDARQRAKLMNTIYVATLDTMHHRYFHGDRAVVPARAMEDIFKDLEAETDIQARWISASLKPMSIDHKPKTDFEKRAAAKIAKGEEMVETIEQGFYRRAGSISLDGGCIHCHAGLFGKPSPSSQFAGLVISIPVHKGAQLPVVNEKSQPENK